MKIERSVANKLEHLISLHLIFDCGIIFIITSLFNGNNQMLPANMHNKKSVEKINLRLYGVHAADTCRSGAGYSNKTCKLLAICKPLAA